MHKEYLASIGDNLDDLKTLDRHDYERIETQLQALAADAMYSRYLAEHKRHKRVSK